MGEENLEKDILPVINIPQMILIGSSGRNKGKTTLACKLIQEWKSRFSIDALKIINIHNVHEKCHRGNAGCGLCSNLSGHFELIRETGSFQEKDTAQLLAAGAQKAFLLKTLRTHIQEGFMRFLERTSKDTLIICESNSLRKVVRPGIFLFIQNKGDTSMKPSARQVFSLADEQVYPNHPAWFEQVQARIGVHHTESGLEVRYQRKQSSGG